MSAIFFLNNFLAHRGLGYLLYFFFLAHRGRGYLLRFFSLAHRGHGYLLRFFFFIRPWGLLMHRKVVLCGSLYYLEYLQIFAANHLVLCEWTYGFRWERILQLGYWVRHARKERWQPLRFLAFL